MREVLRSRAQDIEEIWIGERRKGRRIDEIEQLARERGVQIRRVVESEIEALEEVGGAHNGLVARVASRGGDAGVGDRQRVGADAELVVLLEDIQDPRNLGALLRVCEGAGVGRVLIRDRGSAPMNATVEKASAGAVEWLAVERIINSSQQVKRLKDDGFWIYGADASGAPPWQMDLSGKVVLCLGGEEKGLRELTRKSCDALVGLPMRGQVGSLNVATAAAALLYDVVRQRGE